MTLTFHTRMATYLAHAAKGDLILNKRGDLCQRHTYDADWHDLPWEQHGIGPCLATITRDGWILTASGAQFIIENCPPPSAGDMRKLNIVANERDE